MKKKLKWMLLLVVIVGLLVSFGVAGASTAPAYQLHLNNAAVGNMAGQMSSSSYALTVSMGHAIETTLSSTNYEVCTGFVCQTQRLLSDVMQNVFLPFLVR